MKTIAKHIEYLLSRTDCVIIPGFGAILAHREGALFDSEAGCVFPPRRSFTFNGSLTHTDGTLAGSIARAEGISLTAAGDRIARDVELMMSNLRANGRVQLGRIGHVQLQADGSVSFCAAERDTISASTAWLPTLYNAEAATEPASNILPPVAKVSTASPLAKFARLAASIALLFAIYFVASTPISVDQAALASLTPEIKHTSIEELMPADMEPISTIAIYSAHNPNATISTSATDGHCATAASLKESGAEYLVIVGSCASVQEAEKFLEVRKNPSLRYIEIDGRFRIFAAAFALEVDAYRYISNGDYGSNGAWVCHIR